MVYNYGTFDDTDPDFYIKFTKGIMYYALSAYPYADFLQEYQYQRRGIIEQVLKLSCDEKRTVHNALQVNNTGANRFYYYYFHTDNCTTRAKDIIVKNTGEQVTFKKILPERPVTYRNLIHSYLDISDKYWSKFGIDLFLGMNLDKKPNNQQSMFLPDYLKKGFDSAIVKNRSVVAHTQLVLPWPETPKGSGTIFSPLVTFSVLLLVFSLLSLKRAGWSNKLLLVLDSLFFLIIGLIGTMMVLMWLIRVDTVCRNNLNILWALPTHVIAALFLWSRQKWLRVYFQVVFWLAIVLAFTWFFLPQQLNNGVGPLLLIIIIRSYYYSKEDHARKNT